MSEGLHTYPLASGEELERERDAIFLPEDDWMGTDIADDWLNPEDEWEAAKNAMYIGDAPICSLGGITLLTGQSGHGKTMTIAMIVSTVFRGEYGALKLGQRIENPTVLYVDTEMEKYNTQRLMNRVYYINGWAFKTTHPEFRILRLRDTGEVVDRWKKVLKAIAEVRPTFCILDGLIDLVNDFNDNNECQRIIYKLMGAASFYDMSLIGVIHQNPGGEKMAGHLGSFGERKAITTLLTKKDKTAAGVVFSVEQKKARDKDADKLQFCVNDDNLHIGIPEPIANDIQPQAEEEPDYLSFCRRIIPKDGISTRDLRQAIKSEFNYGSSKADKVLWQIEDDKIVYRDEHKRYFLYAADATQLEIGQTQQAPF